jgi:hypothetical protein
VPLEPKDPNFHERVRSSFARQAAMHTLGVVLVTGELRAYADEHMRGEGDVVALMNGTMMSVRDRPSLHD